MAEAARRAYMRRTTPEQRLDDGIRLSDAMIRAALAREGIVDVRDEETARRGFRILRRLSEA